MPRPAITVFAGTNGAGKSSVIGEFLRKEGGSYFNPDEIARELKNDFPLLNQEQINGYAWTIGKDQLKNAIENKSVYNFETTLGGNTIPNLIQIACKTHDVNIFYVGLSTPELHIERVKTRVLQGGHDIPEEIIRKRYQASLLNLISLMPNLYYLRVQDNSGSIDEGPRDLVIMQQGIITSITDSMPTWAKPVAGAALRLHKENSETRA